MASLRLWLPATGPLQGSVDDLRYTVSTTLCQTHFSPRSAEIIQDCKNIFEHLKPKEDEKDTRQAVGEILKEWDESGKLTDMEGSVAHIQSDNIPGLAEELKKRDVCDPNTTECSISLAYRVYCWVVKNISYSHEVQDSDPLVILRKKKGSCRGYASLFLALAKEVGLQTVWIVNGHTRELAPVPLFQPQDSNGHVWNVVKINDVGFQVDCTFGSGSLTEEGFQYEFSRAYFFPPPEKFILTHWVRDERLQLLEHPIPLGEIRKMIAPSLETQLKGIQPNIFHPFIVLGPNSFTVKIRVKCRDDIISASLHDTENDSMDSSEFKSSKMTAPNENPLISIKRVDDGELVTTLIPKKGRYLLKISYAEKKCFVETSVFNHCLSYVITSENDFSDSDFIGYPEIRSEAIAVKNGFEIREWSTDTSDEQQNEWACQTRSVVNMKIKVTSNNDLTHSICEGKEGVRLDCFTKLKATEDSNIQNLTIMFPSRGWYTVFINCENYMIMKYRVFATDGVPHTIYPYITKEGDSLGISLVDNEKPLTYSESLSIKFHAPSELEFSAQFITPEKSTMQHTDISQQADSGIYTLCAKLPSGTWGLYLFAEGIRKPVMKVNPLYGPHVNPYPRVSQKNIQEYGIELSNAYDRNCKSGFFQYVFNAPCDVIFSYQLVRNLKSEPTIHMEDHHVVINKPKGLSSTENMINILFPSTGEWTLTVGATRDATRAESDGVFELTIEAVVDQPQNKIFPRLTIPFTAMSLQPPTDIHQWMLPCKVSEYPTEIEIEFTQSSDDIELFCETERDEKECTGEDDLTRLRYAAGEQNQIKRKLIVTVTRDGKWKFTIWGHYMKETSGKIYDLLTYLVEGT